MKRITLTISDVDLQLFLTSSVNFVMRGFLHTIKQSKFDYDGREDASRKDKYYYFTIETPVELSILASACDRVEGLSHIFIAKVQRKVNKVEGDE